MFNKRYLLNPGCLVLLCVIFGSAFFAYWIITPSADEQAFMFEVKGHGCAQTKNYEDAYRYFLKSAELSKDVVSTGKRYFFAANVASAQGRFADSIQLYAKALQVDKANNTAKDKIVSLLEKGKISFQNIVPHVVDVAQVLFTSSRVLYYNRFAGGWSRGGKGGALVYANKQCKGTLNLSTYNPSTTKVKVTYRVNDNKTRDVYLDNWEKQYRAIDLINGINTIDITVNKTFVPKQHGLNADQRVLGVNFAVDVACNE